MKNKWNILLTDNGDFALSWPYTRARFEERLSDIANVHYIDLKQSTLEDAAWEDMNAVALFGADLTEEIIERATKLKVAGSITTFYNVGLPACLTTLRKRGIPFIDATPAWSKSVAECGFGLILCSLRKLPHWHRKLANGEFDWIYPYRQFCDDPDFVNGDLGTKTVGIIGMGQIGSRLATWCSAFGARVMAYDPFVPDERFANCDAQKMELDPLMEQCDILIIAVAPTPSALGLVNAERIYRLQKGSLLVSVSRANVMDMNALRTRVLNNELFWASDVFDIEPLPKDDPIIGRDNVVHVPHIAGRTRDANIRLADILADDFTRVYQGEPPSYQLSDTTIKLRSGAGS